MRHKTSGFLPLNVSAAHHHHKERDWKKGTPPKPKAAGENRRGPL